MVEGGSELEPWSSSLSEVRVNESYESRERVPESG